jgi:hypothetical protein
VYPVFALCVANQESGSPGSTSFATVNWRYDDGQFEGAYNWVHSTWEAMKRPSDPGYAVDASPRQQTEVFMAHANANDWPNSVPACGG